MSRFTNTASFKTGQKTVSVSGTPVRVFSGGELGTAGLKVTLRAFLTNTGKITLGNSSANALNSGTSHFPLYPGESVSLQIKLFQDLWIDAAVNGEGVAFIYEA